MTGITGMARMTGMTGMTGMTARTGMIGITRMAGMTGMTARTGVTGMTGTTGMTRMTRMTGMTGITRMTGMTRMTKIKMIKASLDTLMPVYVKLFNSILMVLLLLSINRAGVMYQKTTKVSLSPAAWEYCFALIYLKPATPQTCHVFKYTSQISNWLFTK